jgi:hypothetical protein
MMGGSGGQFEPKNLRIHPIAYRFQSTEDRGKDRKRMIPGDDSELSI